MLASKMDIYGRPIALRYNKNDQYRSNYGLFCTVLSLALATAFVVQRITMQLESEMRFTVDSFSIYEDASSQRKDNVISLTDN